MNEEEKRIINELKRRLNEPLAVNENYVDTCILVDIKDCKQLVNFIDKQQKEIEELRNPTICGRTIEEIVNILNGLDLEKATDLEVTMENLKSFMAIYQKEVEDSLHNATTELISGISGTGARIEFQLPHYDFLKKEKGE